MTPERKAYLRRLNDEDAMVYDKEVTEILDALTAAEAERDEARAQFEKTRNAASLMMNERNEARQERDAWRADCFRAGERVEAADGRRAKAETWASGMKSKWDEHVTLCNEVASKAERERDAMRRERDEWKAKAEALVRGLQKWAQNSSIRPLDPVGYGHLRVSVALRDGNLHALLSALGEQTRPEGEEG